jgi:hypothetical protein
MAIDVNPLNVSALAALAGNNIGYLNLPVADSITPQVKLTEAATQRLSLLQQANDSDLNRQARMAELGMTLQGQQQLNQQQAAQQMALERYRQGFQGQQNDKQRQMQLMQMQQQGGLQAQQLAQQGAYQQGTLNNSSRALDLQQQGMASDDEFKQEQMQMLQMQMALKARADLKQQDLNKRGAFASLVLAGAHAIDPSDQKGMASFIQQKLKLGLDEGIISPEEYKASLNMSPQDVLNHSTMDLLLSGYAKESKDNPVIMKALQGITTGASPLSAATQSKQEQSAISSEHVQNQIDQLKNISKNNPEIFSTVGNIAAEGSIAAGRNSLLKPLVNGAASLVGIDPDKVEQATTAYNTTAGSLWTTIAKNLSPRLLTAANGVLKSQLIPDPHTDSIDSQNAKLDMLQQLAIEKQNLDKQYIKNGVNTNPQVYEDKMSNLFSNISTSVNPDLAPITHNGKTVDVEKTLKDNPTFFKNKDDVINYFKNLQGNQ